MNEIIIAIILGIIEGLTEFLPISSTGHLILVSHLLNFSGEDAKTFTIFIQLGAILAICFIYRVRLLTIFQIRALKKHHQFNAYHVLLGIFPAMLVGFLFHNIIKTYLFSPKTVVLGLILGGILMIYAEYRKSTPTVNNLDALSYKQAFMIGVFQCLAVWPGFSRAGSTMSGGLIVGTDHKTAAEFSFIIAVPIMFAATGYDLLKSFPFLSVNDIPIFVIGFITAFLVAILAVTTFLKILQKIKLTPFAIYRFIIAGIFIVLIF